MKLSSERTHVGLRKPEFDQRMPEARLVHRLDSWAVVAQVRDVHAVCNRMEPPFGRQLLQRCTKLLATEIASVRRVRNVPIVRELGDRSEERRVGIARRA